MSATLLLIKTADFCVPAQKPAGAGYSLPDCVPRIQPRRILSKVNNNNKNIY